MFNRFSKGKRKDEQNDAEGNNYESKIHFEERSICMSWFCIIFCFIISMSFVPVRVYKGLKMGEKHAQLPIKPGGNLFSLANSSNK